MSDDVVSRHQVVFVHSDVAADLTRRVEAGEPLECEVRDGELVKLVGVDVVICDTIGRQPSFEAFSFVTSPKLAPTTILPAAGRGAQWKRERVLAGRRWGR